jgi:xylose isomerase
MSLSELAAAAGDEPELVSGRQEQYENIMNRYL